MRFTRREFCWTVAAAAATGCAAEEGTPDVSDLETERSLPAAASAGAGGDASSPPASGMAGMGGVGGAAPGSSGTTGAAGEPAPRPEAELQPGFSFKHGVASGDPLSDAVILWTRVTPGEPEQTERLRVDYVLARDLDLTQVAARGRFETDAERDYTVKVDITGLSPGTTYYYQFFDPTREDDTRSVLGRTRTLPENPERVRLAVCSCSSYTAGYFNSYAHIAARDDLDAVLHLGDYIYEYGAEAPPGTGLDRMPDPVHEIITLADYRTRHAQYRTDPDLAEVHRQHPFIAVWDDHEIADNTWSDGANNHDPATEGDFEARRAAASQAYAEWMPIREHVQEGRLLLERRFAFGDLLDLIMLDTRTQGRDMQDAAQVGNPTRQLLGAAQEAWLFSELSDSQDRGTRWRLLGQQVMVGQLQLGGAPLNPDQWDGYASARDRLFDHLESNAIDNVVVLTGDIHTSWAIELARDPWTGYSPLTGAGALAVEFVVTSVTSPGLEGLAEAGTAVISATHPHVRWVDLEHRGYAVLDIEHARVACEWYHAATVDEPRSDHGFARGFQVQAGAPRLLPLDMPTSAPPNLPAPA
jgi:alkaline phosphatase D